MQTAADRLFVALDLPDPGQARKLALKLSPLGVGFKVGLELFMAGGPALVAELASKYKIFLDLKYHDIPNTTAAAVREAAKLGVRIINLHAAGGSKMMNAAVKALEGLPQRPLLIAVTVLTSMDQDDLLETGAAGSAAARVELLARLAAQCGLDGVVCSPLEITAVKQAVSPAFVTVTPGVRPAGAAADDQVRVATAADVIRLGGDYLVVGRPITRADDPLKAAAKIVAEMEGV